MPKPQEVLSEALKLNERIKKFLKYSTYMEYSDLSGMEIDFQDGEQIFLWEELSKVTGWLAAAQEDIARLTRPIKEEGILRKGPGGKYQTETGRCYDCGSSIEVLVTDEYCEVPYWTRTTVEHNGEDYCLAGYKDLPMEGLRVRVRNDHCRGCGNPL